MTMDRDETDVDTKNHRHDRLRAHPTAWATVGVFQTLLTAGVVFGWASLLPVLRDEEEGDENADTTTSSFSPQAYSQVFTIGAVGNYISTLFFGALLDHCGPRWTGMTASALFAIGLLLFCTETTTYQTLAIGFGLLGFAGPGIQMPTLHLANLFAGDNKEGGDGGGAIFMSAQAAAFDGGTAIFAILRWLFQSYNVPSSTFFRIYLIIPIWVFVTSLFIWPDEILEKLSDDDDDDDDDDFMSTPKDYVGIGSPYLSPARLSGGSGTTAASRRRNNNNNRTTSLVNAPLSVILRRPAFYALAIWTSVHILKLNFVVATINDQLAETSPEISQQLMDIFGAMLPFGFVALPIVAKTLSRSAFEALQSANVVGIVYGVVLLMAPTNFWLLTLCVFPFVATSRQLVYSTVFSQIGEVFGFANYGILLGLINISVSGFSTIQNPLVDWAETVQSYYPANFILLVITLPLFGIAYFADPKMSIGIMGGGTNSTSTAGESLPLLSKRGKITDSERSGAAPMEKARVGRPRGLSDGGVL